MVRDAARNRSVSDDVVSPVVVLSSETIPSEVGDVAGEPLVIIGAGMAAQRLCERLVEQGATERWRLVLLGEESEPPYDRIRLGECVAGEDRARLRFRGRDWYEEHGIELRLGTRVTGIDREARLVRTADGQELRYARLVLATGSRPRVPEPFDVADPRILTYRTIADAGAIRDAAKRAEGRARCVVVGGGLLGLEVARDLQKLGASVRVLEAATHLLSRQLDVGASTVLLEHLEKLGIDVRLGARVSSVECADGGISISFGSQDASEQVIGDVVVLAIGVEPADELPRRAGLACVPRGGVRVDASMRTSDPNIDAIGECAVYRGEAIGLVAPCYDMAEVVATRLAGRRARYRTVPRVTKLKLDTIEVAAVGRGLEDEVGQGSLELKEDGLYRRLVVRRGKLIGAISVGEWSDLPMVVQGVIDGGRIGGRERRRFEARESLWPEMKDNPAAWSDDVPICTCTGATCGSVRAAIADGCGNVEQLGARTGAGTVCGSCRPALGQLVGIRIAPPAPERGLGVVGVLAFVGLVLALVLGPIGYASTVDASGPTAWLDALWRDNLARQISGFSLAGVSLLSLVVSLRKRVKWFRLGTFRAFRLVHALLGMATVAGFGVHTGFRLGANLDRALGVLFVMLLGVGGVAAIAAALEPRLPARIGASLRGNTVRVHQILFWAFPVLVVIHVVKVFYF